MFSSNTSQVSNDVKYIEDFCSVYLRTGTGSSQTVTTGVKENTGALVISKSRSAATDWAWYDTFRGATKELASNTTAAEITQSQGLTSFNTDGHTWGTLAKVNTSGATYVDFVLKPTPKFFDVVTYTGDGSGSRSVLHSLGVAPGAVFIKRTDSTSNWLAHHKGNGLSDYSTMRLNQTNANLFNVGSGNFTATDFIAGNWGTLATGVADDNMNVSGATYVAYLFAHNAGGFGLTGTDNVISCGSYTGTGATGNNVTLGYEPQWLMIKAADRAQDWFMFDAMRGMTTTGGTEEYLLANTSDAAGSGAFGINPTATGFGVNTAGTSFNASGETYIYIAIRRGPMKTPTSGTSVYSAQTTSGNGTQRSLTGVGFAPDLYIAQGRTTSGGANLYSTFFDRLRGKPAFLLSAAASTENTSTTDTLLSFDQNGVTIGADGGWAIVNRSTETYVHQFLRRAPGFFDEVCWTGTSSNGGASATFNHNLGVVPEMIIVKLRAVNGASGHTPDWFVYTTALNSQYGYPYNGMYLNSSAAFTGVGMISSAPTATTFALEGQANVSPATYVAYLFASCPGVQSIQSYVGDGTTGRTINCGFTGGARFVCIKATSTTGSWWTFDSARGIVTNNDPALQLNSTAAEVTSADAVDTAASGFIVNQEATCSLNASGVTYLVWAIA